MLRRLGLATVAALAMTGGVAQAQECVCVKNAATFATKVKAHDGLWWIAVDQRMQFNGLTARQRRKTKTGVYDWQKDKGTDDAFKAWCRKNKTACAATVACLVAGGGTYAQARIDGRSVGRAMEKATVACAEAATGVWATGKWVA